MRISVICSERKHPGYRVFEEWCATKRALGHEVELICSKKEVSGGDLLFLISCHEIIGPEVRNAYQKSLVIHASDLPCGKGWSPLVWQILEGKNEITVTLLEAEDKLDSGDIWHKVQLKFKGHELVDEINKSLFDAEIWLMDFAVENFQQVQPTPQPDHKNIYYPKRNPEDSRIDPQQSIAEQFDKLRIADPDRYPAFFCYQGHCYEIRLTKVKGSFHEEGE